ncbi:MAG: DUF4097 family beta strand repeat-containing protein [Armatimonadota bacterium]|nr:DUF4097 family beta strand repeat-containing protein [Armatimonadota bacterium]MDR7452093.1 DUF4097 family beta strand repeat-containing protein [Armatimonadota bacterium]MDR7466555.1 DUF4097 family beta strand repeat-containing protein [Armatimonadota bacterium]MDR7493277.1 DUF4097 family beta strand repeat-containing protein [Armatimonadota bacterium]MDR7499830.1 DUF4097 family beta strand repeat-containing protein [Armatimonadota bacterium]
MDEEREMVLRMLKEGKISVEEADALLQELADQSKEAPEGGREEGRAASRPGEDLEGVDVRVELRRVLKELTESIPREVMDEIRRTREVFRPTFVEVLRGLRGLTEGRAETTAEEAMRPGETLDLRHAWGDVRISAADEGPMRLRAVKRVWALTAEEARREAEALPVEVRRDGSSVVVHVPRPAGRRARVDFEITVPRGVGARIDVAKGDLSLDRVAGAELHVARGDVRVAGLEGALRADVVSGDLEIRRVEGDVRVDIKSGDVAASDIRGRVEGRILNGDVAIQESRGAALDLVNGDVDLRRVAGPVAVTTKSGDVRLVHSRSTEVNVRTLAGEVEIDLEELVQGAVVVETISGDITLAVPADSRATIDASTRSGSVSVGLPLTEQTAGVRSLRGVLNGPGATVRLLATSGDVVVRGR